MIRTVVLTEEAEADVRRLILFLAERAPQAALRANRTIRQALASLDQLSERGRPSDFEGYRELVIPYGQNAYIARYRVAGDEVVVTRIHHRYEDRGH